MDDSVLLKNTSRCSAQILFEWRFIRQEIDRFILHEDRNPYFNGFTVFDELFVKVTFAVEPGSRKSLIKVGHGEGTRQILYLADSSYWSADGMAWLQIEISNLSKAFSKNFNHIV